MVLPTQTGVLLEAVNVGFGLTVIVVQEGAEVQPATVCVTQ